MIVSLLAVRRFAPCVDADRNSSLRGATVTVRNRLSCPSVSTVQRLVAQSADAARLHATAPALLLELQTQLGILAATATRSTERGRRPFRPTGDWAGRLGELAYGIYLLADQTGVDIDAEVTRVATMQLRHAEQNAAAGNAGWPFTS